MDHNIKLTTMQQGGSAIFGDFAVTKLQESLCNRNVICAVPITFSLQETNRNMYGFKDSRRTKEDETKTSHLVEELLEDIYNNNIPKSRNNSVGSCSSSFVVDSRQLHKKQIMDLQHLICHLKSHIERSGSLLLRELKRRDALRRQQDAHCSVITGQLQKRSSVDGAEMCFSMQPAPGESGFSQWATAMKMVAQLPGGIPPDFRKRLWIILAERHLTQLGVDWGAIETNCFSEWSHPADSELGVQIVKDLHRTGCSLFCGADGQENQALLKRVLLAYARWNKAVGYCQGFNMLAALILQVTDKCETDALKLMIYLIEGVLPDSYFADSLRGLSVDMAVFRELLRTRLPRLSRHLDTLQNAAKEGNTSYEPPLTNVFTMQWFLTLFCNCLPQPTVLRVWDLILLEGNEVLLRTALAIWQTLADRIVQVKTADEFYCVMGVLTRDLLEFNLIEGNSLIKAVVAIGPLNELGSLREHYLYNINPWGSAVSSAKSSNTTANDKQLKTYPKENLVLDISALKKQYAKLKQRQRQAHIIFSAAISRQPPPSAQVAVNHLLLGKSALVPARRLGPPKGSIPPVRLPPSTLHWKDTPRGKPEPEEPGSSSSSDTELCDDPGGESSSSATTPSQEVPEKDGKISQLPVISDNPDDNIRVEKLVECEPEVEVEKIENPIIENREKLDNFLPEVFTNLEAVVVKDDLMSESDNDSEDFENFLQDRIHCLKESASIENDGGFCAASSRRNSERALQIIQENSMILHRILQCQSRLSPPPILEDVEDLKPAGFQLEKSPDEETSPEYGSRYRDILEKSRNLDERYNSLILNAKPVSELTRDNLLKFSSASLDSCEPPKSDFKLGRDFSCRSWDLDEKSDVNTCDKNETGRDDDDPVVVVVDEIANKSFQLSPTATASNMSNKSKVFNPFPVPLSPRQNKEVPLKLGMYKK